MGAHTGVHRADLTVEQRDLLFVLIGRRWPWPCTPAQSNAQWAVMQQLAALGLVQRIPVMVRSTRAGSWMLTFAGGQVAQRIKRSRSSNPLVRPPSWLPYRRRSGGLHVRYRAGRSGRWPEARPLRCAR